MSTRNPNCMCSCPAKPLRKPQRQQDFVCRITQRHIQTHTSWSCGLWFGSCRWCSGLKRFVVFLEDSRPVAYVLDLASCVGLMEGI